jgi:S1-C subfamily serine protease
MNNTDSTDVDQTKLRSHSVTSSKINGRSKQIHITLPDVNRYNWQKLKRPKEWGGRVVATGLIVIALLAGYAGAWLENTSNNGSVTFANLGGQEKVVTSQSQLINQIAKSVGPSVVSVNVDITSSGSSTGSNSGSATGGFGLYGFSQPEQEEAAGTGIILSSNGLIITNRHVVPEGTTNVSVTLSDGTELKNVSVIGRTSSEDSLDIAFLKINNTEGHKLTPAVIGDSSQVQVGDSVVAIGNALGQFQNTVTSGIISGYGRSVQATDSSGTSQPENLDDLFQTDAAINEGNSGGPLVNMNGQIIGINTATAGDAQNIGFAIPINDAKGLIEQVTKTGKFSTPYLGIRYIPLTADVANEYNLSVDNGAFIAPSSSASSPSIITGGPADKSGLKQGDIITAVNGTKIDQGHSLTSLLDQYEPGNMIKLMILNGTNTRQVEITLGSTPNS